MHNIPQKEMATTFEVNERDEMMRNNLIRKLPISYRGDTGRSHGRARRLFTTIAEVVFESSHGHQCAGVVSTTHKSNHSHASAVSKHFSRFLDSTVSMIDVCIKGRVTEGCM